MIRFITFIPLTILFGCSSIQHIVAHEEVKPWQKEVLAQKSMSLPFHPLHSYTDDHIYFSKEASTGGNGVGGGGCGCN